MSQPHVPCCTAVALAIDFDLKHIRDLVHMNARSATILATIDVLRKSLENHRNLTEEALANDASRIHEPIRND